MVEVAYVAIKAIYVSVLVLYFFKISSTVTSVIECNVKQKSKLLIGRIIVR